MNLREKGAENLYIVSNLLKSHPHQYFSAKSVAQITGINLVSVRGHLHDLARNETVVFVEKIIGTRCKRHYFCWNDVRTD